MAPITKIENTQEKNSTNCKNSSKTCKEIINANILSNGTKSAK